MSCYCIFAKLARTVNLKVVSPAPVFPGEYRVSVGAAEHTQWAIHTLCPLGLVFQYRERAAVIHRLTTSVSHYNTGKSNNFENFKIFEASRKLKSPTSQNGDRKATAPTGLFQQHQDANEASAKAGVMPR